jgi:hypothetical protein
MNPLINILYQNRIDLTVSFQTNYTGIQVNAGDVIAVTNAAYGWTNKQFRVMQVKESTLPNGSLGAAFQCIAYDPSVYTTPNITGYAPTPNSNLAYIGYFSAFRWIARCPQRGVSQKSYCFIRQFHHQVHPIGLFGQHWFHLTQPHLQTVQ